MGIDKRTAAAPAPHEHDDLHAESIEDIIDVENEMGFGEGEDWGRDDHVDSSKHGGYRRRSPQRTASHDRVRARSSPPQRQVDDRMQTLSKHQTAGNVAISPQRTRRDPGSSHQGEQAFINDVKDDLEVQHFSMEQKDDNGSIEPGVKTDTNESGKRAMPNQSGEKKVTLDKHVDKPSIQNRVRFSLDLETAEKILGPPKKSIEKAKVHPQQEAPWRFGRVVHSDSRGYGMDKGADRHRGLVKRRELDQGDGRRDMGLEGERPVEERKAFKSAQEKIEKLEDALQKQQEIVVNMKSSLGSDGVKDYIKLRQLLDDLDENLKRLPNTTTKPRLLTGSSQSKVKTDQIEELKAQCALLETDRERLKKKMRYLLENSKGREKELAPLRTERERLLERKVKDLEFSLEDWETKFKGIETDFSVQRSAWEQSLKACKFDWKDKKHRWVMKLKEKETELSNLKNAQERLLDSLHACQRCMSELKRLASAISGSRKDKGTSEEGTILDKESCSTSFADMDSVDGVDALELALHLQAQAEDLHKLLQVTDSAMAPQSEGYMVDRSVLMEEREVLEKKISQTLFLMDGIKQEMKAKESRIMKENQRFERLISEKVEQVERLEKLLQNRENDTEVVVEELKTEAKLLNKEIEQERSDRLKLLESQAEIKQKLMKGLRKKEQKWEEEVGVLKVKLDEMAADVAVKDEAIESLEERLKTKDTQINDEKQKWVMAMKEVKQKAAKTIVRFVQGKENGLLEHLRDRRKARKMAEGKIILHEDDQDYQDVNGERDHNERGLQLRRSLELGSSRELQPLCKHLMGFTKACTDENLERPLELSKMKVKQDDCSSIINEDLGKSLESFNVRVKQDDHVRRKERTMGHACHTQEELLKKGLKWGGGKGDFKSMERQDVLRFLEAEKGSGENAFAILKDTVQELEWSLQHGREKTSNDLD